MSSSLAAAVERYRFNETLLDRVTAGFGDAEWRYHPEAGGNPAIWIIGHIAVYRRRVARRLGEAIPDAPWEPLFARGSTPDAEAKGYPSPADLRQDVARSGEALCRRALALTPDQAAQKWDWPMPGFTAEQSLHFFHAHESYHLGQIGYLRRTRGLAGIA
jgi:hypothetical protein